MNIFYMKLTISKYGHWRLTLSTIKSMYNYNILLIWVKTAIEKRQFVPYIDPHPFLSSVAETHTARVTN